MRYQVLKDQLEIYDKYRVHWAIWTYKDIGLQGLVHADPKSAWMERLRPFLDKKARLGADRWGSRDDGIRDALEPVEALMEREFPDFKPYPFGRKWLIHRLLRHVLISEALLPEFGELFRGVGVTEAEELAGAFRFDNCVVRTKLVELLREHAT